MTDEWSELAAAPPRTIRPVDHFIVRALEAEDRGGAWLDLLEQALRPGPWKVETSDGFWWIPFRLRHHVSVETDGSGGRALCRSEFVLVEDVQDIPTALQTVNYYNLRPLAWIFWLDLDAKRICASSTVMLDPVNWFHAFVFFQGVSHSVGILERLAPRLAESVSGRLPDARHPQLGVRGDPDPLLGEHLLVTLQPEASAGLWFAEPEILRFRSALRYLLESDGIDAWGLHLFSRLDNQLTSAENLACTLKLPFEVGDTGSTGHSPVTTARLALRDHPDFGYGIERLLVTPVHVPSERMPDVPEVASYEGLAFTNWLNTREVDLPSSPLGVAPWCLWRGQLCNVLFIDGETSRTLQSIAMEACGDVFALITATTSVALLSTFAEAVTRSGVEGLEVTDEGWWDGVEDNGGEAALLLDNRSAVPAVTDGLPRNKRLDPLDVTDDLWGLPHGRVAATFGIFNPAGPSVGSVEVAVDYEQQLGLVLERLRHPFSPSLLLHAVLDREGYKTRSAIVREVIAELEWGLLDWCHVVDPDEEVAGAVYDGLRIFGERSSADLVVAADALVEHVVSPWLRLLATEPPSNHGRPDDPIASWVDVLTRPDNVDTHVAHLRSAWEGAKLFVRDDDDLSEAQSVANRLELEVLDRLSAGGS